MSSKLSCGEYLGQALKRRRVAGLLLTETTYAAGARLPPHSHENAYLSLTRHGSYTETLGRRTRSCDPLTLAFHPAGEVHAQEFHNAPTRSFNVELDPGWLQRVQEYTGRLAEGAAVRGGSAPPLALKLYKEFNHADDASPLVIEGLALELVGELCRKAWPVRRKKLTPVWLARAWDLIEARFTEDLKVEDVAAEVGVHPVHLSTVFRRVYRCGVGDRVRWLRVEYAAEQLAQTDLPPATIAHQAGFCNLSHLSMYFKKQKGITPSAFRRSLRRSG
jgi:AraC family transcriptional regulator